MQNKPDGLVAQAPSAAEWWSTLGIVAALGSTVVSAIVSFQSAKETDSLPRRLVLWTMPFVPAVIVAGVAFFLWSVEREMQRL